MNLRRMKNIKRANNYPVINRTDVAQHSYYVAMLAMLLKDEYDYYLNNSGFRNVVVDTEVLLRKCLLHDFEESFTSDIPYTTKHSSDKLHREFESAISNRMNTILSGSDTGKFWDDIRCNSKDNSPEGKIVSLCDMLELAIYCYEEITIGNRNIIPLLNNCITLLESLEEDVVYSLCGDTFTASYMENISPSIHHLVQLVSNYRSEGLQTFLVDFL